MKLKLVASLLLLSGCLGREQGDYPSHPDSQPVQTEEAFTNKNGTRLNALAGWRCEDGTQSLTGGFFDTKTKRLCGLTTMGSWDTGPFYCSPSGANPNPNTDVRCDRSFSP